jgi:hypothetical protein
MLCLVAIAGHIATGTLPGGRRRRPLWASDLAVRRTDRLCGSGERPRRNEVRRKSQQDGQQQGTHYPHGDLALAHLRRVAKGELAPVNGKVKEW